MEWGAVAYLAQSVYGIYKDDNTCNIANMEFKEIAKMLPLSERTIYHAHKNGISELSADLFD